MPELPDVEVYRRYLEKNAADRSIDEVTVSDAKILHGTSASMLRKRLRHAKLTGTRRHGKTLFASIEDGRGWLVLHFGMDGRLRAYGGDEERPRFERLRLDFEDGGHLAYDSKRMLGDVNLTRDAEGWISDHDLGPDALDIDEPDFVAAMEKRRGSVKAAITNQRAIAGVGNVYADEILFQARLHPLTPVTSIVEKDLRRLYRVMRKVLDKSIEKNADPARMPKGWLLRRREEGRECPRCAGGIERIKVSQRSTYLCPSCQPPPADDD